MATETERWVSADEVAEHLSMTAQWVRDMARDDELPGVKFGIYWRFRISEVDAEMERRASGPRSRR